MMSVAWLSFSELMSATHDAHFRLTVGAKWGGAWRALSMLRGTKSSLTLSYNYVNTIVFDHQYLMGKTGLHILDRMRIILELWICFFLFFLEWCNLRNKWSTLQPGREKQTNKMHYSVPLYLPLYLPFSGPSSVPHPAVLFLFLSQSVSFAPVGTDWEGLIRKVPFPAVCCEWGQLTSFSSLHPTLKHSGSIGVSLNSPLSYLLCLLSKRSRCFHSANMVDHIFIMEIQNCIFLVLGNCCPLLLPGLFLCRWALVCFKVHFTV